jgi:hypothetical protein
MVSSFFLAEISSRLARSASRFSRHCLEKKERSVGATDELAGPKNYLIGSVSCSWEGAV